MRPDADNSGDSENGTRNSRKSVENIKRCERWSDIDEVPSGIHRDFGAICHEEAVREGVHEIYARE